MLFRSGYFGIQPLNMRRKIDWLVDQLRKEPQIHKWKKEPEQEKQRRVDNEKHD